MSRSLEETMEDIGESLESIANTLYGQKDDGPNLRDRFAMAAMQAALNSINPRPGWDFALLAKRAYEAADAMLAARDEENPK